MTEKTTNNELLNKIKKLEEREKQLFEELKNLSNLANYLQQRNDSLIVSNARLSEEIKSLKK
jgi:regulator of replication initiation timing